MSITFTRDRPYYMSPTFYLDGSNDRDLLLQSGSRYRQLYRWDAVWTSETRFGANISNMSRVDALFNVQDPNRLPRTGHGAAGSGRSL